MKFSLIVPVYNVEDYVLKCLKSINEQTYSKYEVIIVDDGSLDKSAKIIKNYIKDKEKFRYYKKENGGLSDARNYGISLASGDYLLFVDSDDYINKELLYYLNEELLKNKVDVIKFGLNFINNNKKRLMKKKPFSNLNPDDAISLLLEEELLEPAWLYCYKQDFWQKNNFKFYKGRVHEDFGLTPLILIKAKNISNISYPGYNYVIRENSIMTSNSEEKILKKFNDYYSFYEENIPQIKTSSNINSNTKALLCSFYANGIIEKAKTLDKNNFNKFLKKFSEDNIYDNLIADNLKRKIKKYCYSHFSKLFIKRESVKH